MEIEKILRNVPFCISGGETLYSALKLETKMHELKAYNETENVLITPFYVDSIKGWRYEMYEYELNILITESITFTDYAKRFFSTPNLDKVDSIYLNRLKRCFISARKSDNILLPVQDYLAFILWGEEIKRDYQHSFSEYNAENVYIAVY